MTGKPAEPSPSANSEAIAVAAAIILLSNGVLSALTGTWIPTLVALALLTGAGLYGMLSSRDSD